MQATLGLPSATVIIATYNRPDDLAECVESVTRQTVKPLEVIVVDDGDLLGFPLQEECEKQGIECIYRRKAEPGLTASRNLGISLARGEAILFLDDDVVLSEDYVEQVLQTFADDPEGVIGGVGGLESVDRYQLDWWMKVRYFLDCLFLNSGRHEGRVLPSGFCTEYGTTPFRIREMVDVDFLIGAASSFRKSLFDEFSFSLGYKGYGLGEDKDFSYRVSRKYRVVANPKATLLHKTSPLMRYDKPRRSREFVIAKYRFFKDLVKRSPMDWLFFWYAVFGYILIRTLIMLLRWQKDDVGRVQNALSAVADIIKGRTPV